jgi:hypothetical protein
MGLPAAFLGALHLVLNPHPNGKPSASELNIIFLFGFSLRGVFPHRRILSS